MDSSFMERVLSQGSYSSYTKAGKQDAWAAMLQQIGAALGRVGPKIKLGKSGPLEAALDETLGLTQPEGAAAGPTGSATVKPKVRSPSRPPQPASGKCGPGG